MISSSSPGRHFHGVATIDSIAAVHHLWSSGFLRTALASTAPSAVTMMCEIVPHFFPTQVPASHLLSRSCTASVPPLPGEQ